MGCIYAHILHNKNSDHDGWMYVGQTTNVDLRWNKKEESYKTSQFIYNAMIKYGWNAFEHIIIEDCVPDDKLDEREIFWIKHYHTYFGDPEYKGGFNLTEGGNGTKGIKPSLKGKMPKNYKAMTELKKKPIECLTSGIWHGKEFYKGQVWDSIKDCAIHFNVRSSTVGLRIHNKENYTSGPLFSFVGSNENYDVSINKERLQRNKEAFINNGHKLSSIHKSGPNINYRILCEETGQIFDRVIDCAKAFNMSRGTLNEHLVHPDIHKTAKNYHFKKIPKTT